MHVIHRAKRRILLIWLGGSINVYNNLKEAVETVSTQNI